MVSVNEIGAARRRSVGVLVAMALIGAASTPRLVRAQGPGLPPPPPQLEIPDGNGGGGNGGGAAAPAPNGGVMDNGGQAPTAAAPQGIAAEVTLPIVLQGSVRSVKGSIVTLNVPNGVDFSMRQVDITDATYANANGLKVDKFTVKQGDPVVIVTEAPKPDDTVSDRPVQPQSLKALVVEKNIAAGALGNKKAAK